jgi:conjugal transfer mating pair stabilization protein TraN
MKHLHRVRAASWLPAMCAMSLLLLSSFSSAQTAVQNAFQDGKTFGNNRTTNAFGIVNGPNAPLTVPGFSFNAPQDVLFGNGKGTLLGPTISKLTDCAGTAPANAFTAQECNAINHMRSLPVGWSVKGDGPAVNDVLGASKDKVVNPGAYNGSSSGTVCKTVTRSFPEKYVTETCNEAVQTDYPVCEKKLIVNVVWERTCPANTISGPTTISSDPPYPPQYQCLVRKVQVNPICPAPLIGPPLSQIDGTFQCKTVDSTYVVAPNETTTQDVTETRSAIPRVTESWSPECDVYERAANDKFTKPVTCELQKQTCTQGPETRTMNGLAVTRECWAQKEDFACIGKATTKECESIAGKSCTFMGGRCLEFTNQTNLCAVYTNNYRCLSAPAQTQTATVCDAKQFCDGSAGTACFDTSSPADQEFARAAGSMEAAREAGVYLKDSQLFRGTRGTCSVKVLGGSTIKSCCKGQPGAANFKNSAVLNAGISAGMTIAGEAGKEVLRAGTTFAYDALYQSVDGTFLQKGVSAARDLASGIGDGVFNPSFSFYGFTFTFDFTNGFQFTGFDPVSFAIAVGLQLIQQWLSCDANDQMTMVKKGGNLCTPTEEYCSKRLPIIRTCIEKTEAYCCFNSTLAKIINRQGSAWLGKDLKQCGGFSESEFASLDLSLMNFDEFLAEIVNPASGDALAIVRTGADVSRLLNNYFQTGKQRP